jgi:membrane-associated phospholipid phosphatase
VLLFTFFYRATGGLMFLAFDRFYDDRLAAFELAVLGVNPTLFFDRYLLSSWVNEVFSLCYLCFYPMIPVFVLALFFKKRCEVIKSFLAAACLTFFVSYLLFSLYPVEGPRWYFTTDYANRIEGPVFRQLVELVIDNAAVRGGAMPSSHFGVALVILLYTFRHFPKAGWFLLPVNVGLAVGTVWGRFHYVSDVVVGGLLGLLCTFTVWKYDRVPVRRSVSDIADKELTTEHVS